MQQLRKLMMTLVALLALTTQTWAADLQVTQLTTEMISSWQDNNVNVTLGDLQALGFVEVDQNVVEAWTGAPTSGDAYLICGFTTGDLVKIARFNDGKFEAWADAAAKSIVYLSVSTAPHYIITSSGPAVTPTETANEWSLTMPGGNVLVNVAYKDRTATKVMFGATEITAQSNAVTGYMGFEAAFAEQIAATVQNIEPTFNQTPGDPTPVNDPTLTYISSNPSVIAFQTGTNDPTASGALADIKFLKAGTVTLTVQYTGTTDLGSSQVDLAVTVAQPATLTLASNDVSLGTVELVMPESGLLVKQVTQEMVANWDEDQTLLTADHLTGFQEMSPEKAQAWTGAPNGQSDGTVLYYGFDGDEAISAFFYGGSYTTDEKTNIHLANVFNQVKNPNSYVYYTAGYAPVTVIDNGNGTYNIIPGTQVTLNVTPAEGCELKEWTEGADVSDNEDGTWTLTVGATATTINLTATFDEKTYTVSLADNTEDADSWKGKVGDATTYGDLPIDGLKEGDAVTLKYNGRLKVKSVTAVSDAVPPVPEDGTILPYTDGSGKQRNAIVVTLGEKKYAIATENETSDASDTKDGMGYYTFDKACDLFAKGHKDGSYTTVNVWRLPTYNELDKLKDLTSSWQADPAGRTWTIGSNSLFLPASGYWWSSWQSVGSGGKYWSSTPSSVSGSANNLTFSNYNPQWAVDSKNYKCTVRLICQLQSEISGDDIGKVIGANGTVYASKAEAEEAGTTASGIIAYVGNKGSVEEGTKKYRGLAIALTDAGNGGYQWYEQKDEFDQVISCLNDLHNPSTDIPTSLSYMDGLASTNSLVSGCDLSHTHPAAIAARNYSVSRPSGASGWFLPSIGQWNMIVNGLTNTTIDFTNDANDALKGQAFSKKLTDAGGSALTSIYWSSTEYNDTKVWNYTGISGSVLDIDKVAKNTYRVRAVFAF